MPLHCEPGFVRDYATRLLPQVIKSCCPVLLSLAHTRGAIHSTKISRNLGPKLNGSVRSNRESFEKTGPPFEVDYFSRSDQLEFWLNGSRPRGQFNKAFTSALLELSARTASKLTLF